MAELKYKCLCMSTEATLQVADRDLSRDVVEWMHEIVQPSIGYDHRRRSPHCRQSKMEYAKIPIDEASGALGAKPRHS